MVCTLHAEENGLQRKKKRTRGRQGKSRKVFLSRKPFSGGPRAPRPLFRGGFRDKWLPVNQIWHAVQKQPPLVPWHRQTENTTSQFWQRCLTWIKAASFVTSLLQNVWGFRALPEVGKKWRWRVAGTGRNRQRFWWGGQDKTYSINVFFSNNSSNNNNNNNN